MHSYRSVFFGAPALRPARGAGPPTPPDEHPPPTHPMLRAPTTNGTCSDGRRHEDGNEEIDNLGHQFEDVALSWRGWKASRHDVFGMRGPYEDGQSKYLDMSGAEIKTADGSPRGLEEATRWANANAPEQENARHENRAIDFARPNAGLIGENECERVMWETRVRELEMENLHLKHTIYMSALAATPMSNSSGSGAIDRPETRTLRQQLACLDEHCQSLTSKMARLQEQVTDSHRLLAQERQERAEERNNQLTVVVAKHGLERRMRNREQDLQAEWRRNAELSEKCQKLQEDLAKAQEAGTNHIQQRQSPQNHRPNVSMQESANDDDWTDTTTHLPPEFGYSKYVRWKKRTREGHDHRTGGGKKQRRATPEAGRLQLAGSESPPHVITSTEPAGPGASAIDHMISGEFTESETPSRAMTPPSLPAD